MKRAAIVAVSVALSVALVGCGPSLSSLVADKHYREAICAAHDGSEGDREHVARSLAGDSGLLLHAHVLSAKELEPVLGDATEPVKQRADFVRVKLRTNRLPVDALDAWVTIRNDGGGRSAAPAGWQTLAWATNETLPARRRVSTYATPQNMLKGLGAVLTVGLSLPFTEFRPGELEVDAPPSAYRAQAPLATALHGSMVRPACRPLGMPGGSADPPSTGRDCERYYVFEKGSEGRWTLVVKQRFVALRVGSHISDSDEKSRCFVDHEAEMALGASATLRTDALARFGDRMRRVPVD